MRSSRLSAPLTETASDGESTSIPSNATVRDLPDSVRPCVPVIRNWWRNSLRNVLTLAVAVAAAAPVAAHHSDAGLDMQSLVTFEGHGRRIQLA